MKKTTKKLVLSKETLRTLNDGDLQQAAGGMRDSANNCEVDRNETRVNCYPNVGRTSGYHGCCP